MSDIFLSYAREDLERVKPLALALIEQGWSVFWDQTIPAGKTWHNVIDKALTDARCVIVAWSSTSINSKWVYEEADEGMSREILVPVLLDEVKPPRGFRLIQAERFVDWNGETQSAVFGRLVDAVSNLLGPPNRSALFPSPAPIATPAKPAKTKQPSKRSDLILPEMITIPAGEFRMGDLTGNGDASERPVHKVRIAQPFGIGKYTVTFDEFDVFAKATGHARPEDEGWGRGRRPVINVSWNDAVAYAQWLTKQTGQLYRLPSEAEWEYAARAGTKTDYWWGNDIGSNRANCHASGSQWSNEQTAPVGSFEPNPWGLYDTAGNVWEWVQDQWHVKYEGAPIDGSAWETNGGSQRVLRGGSWNNFPDFVRSAFRNWYGPGNRNLNRGFRLARTL